MAKTKPQPVTFQRIVSGISDYEKESVQVDSVAFARQIDFRTNPRKWRLLPKTIKESGGTVVTDLPVWGDRISTDSYVYGDSGKIYKRTSSGVVTLEKTVPNSHGNGLKYFGEDGFMYYTSDTLIGRYGRIGSSPTWVDDFLGAQGGVPLNTHSLELEAGSSQYATAADSASVSITGDLALECWIKPESLPSAGSEMVLLSKWNENTNRRSYKMSVAAISGYFGDGSDGALTISADTTDAPIDSTASGTSGQFTLSATNASFAAGQIIFIHQTRGTGAGTCQRNKILSYTAGTITLENALNFSYATSGANCAQVLVVKQYTTVVVNSGKTWSCKEWDGSVGGILSFVASVSFTNSGTVNAQYKGFRGASAAPGDATQGYQGEGTGGDRDTASQAANGNGGGGGLAGGTNNLAGGGGGSNVPGTVGEIYGSATGGAVGDAVGTSDLTTMTFGGGGGSGGLFSGGGDSKSGGRGGAIVFISAVDIVLNSGSLITVNGQAGTNGVSTWDAPGGGAAAGSVLLKFQTATLGTNLITANGGAAGTAERLNGGTGGNGRIHADYYTSYTGTTSPTITASQDSSLVTNVTYQLRLQLSSDGSAEETLSKSLSSIAVDRWAHLACSWDASGHIATFFEDGNSLGTVTGAITSLNDNNSLFAIGASFNSGAGAAENFFDGKVDDVRVWGAERTAAQIVANKEVHLAGTETGLKAYFQVNNSTSDTASTPDADNLTLVNTPVYSTDVPFSAATTRQDIDQQDSSTGNTYALGTAIDEGASHRQTFVPAKDPQKSIGIYVSDTGDDSDWTLTVHDPQNRVIASATITHANLVAGHNEFVFSSVWRPVIGATYHFHLTATTTTGAPAVVSGTASNLETGQFKSYYQFLVSDIYHPIEHTGNILSIGNERYVAVQDPAGSYNPHRLTLPSGWRVRCIAKWREYYAYGCMRGDSVSDYDQGLIVFWDGYSTTYNFFIDVPEGAVNSMLGSQGTLYIVAGYQGDILEYVGGDKATKVKRIPKITDDKYIEVLPGAMSMWRTLLHIGAGVTDSAEVEQGVYSWGRRNSQYSDSLSFDYKISTGTTQSTGVKIGLLMPVNKKLLIGWKDNVSFGLDNVDPSNDPYSEGSIEWLVRDEGGMWKEKMTEMVRADFDPLNTGESVGLQYKLDGASSWSAEESESDAGADKLRWQPQMTRHKEWQVRLNLATTVSTSPKVSGVNIMEDLLTDEEVE